jgi:hypothetical protein
MVKKLRPIRVVGDVAYITLSGGVEAVVDAADADAVRGYNWHCKFAPSTSYAATNQKVGHLKYNGLFLHRLIMQPDDGFFVDHINGNGLDNRRENLRVVSHSQNMMNSRKPVSNTSGIKGVSWYAKTKKWKAQIAASGKKMHIGYYCTKEEAAKAYAEASRRLHKQFGRTA